MKTKVKYLVLLSIALGVWSLSYGLAQKLDLTKSVITLECNEHHFGTEKAYITDRVTLTGIEREDLVTITINAAARTIQFFEVSRNKVLYDVNCMSTAQSNNTNAAGQMYKETLILVQSL